MRNKRIEDTELAEMHERQVAVLSPLSPTDRYAVWTRARLLANLGPGIFSQHLRIAAEELARLGADGLEQKSRDDNRHALEACARRGCIACARSLGWVQ